MSIITSPIKWEDPPERTGRRYFDPSAIMEHLSAKDHIGHWAVIVEDVSANYRTSPTVQKLIEDGAEVVIRAVSGVNGKKQYNVYARVPSAKRAAA